MAPMYGGVAPQDLNVQAESLQTFKKRVDRILRELEGGAASNEKVSDQRVARASFGGEFGEANDLYTQYNRVHSLLTTLSGTLGDQIEAIGIAVLGAHNGFKNLDDDVKRRFWAIQGRAQQREQYQRNQQHERQREEDKRLGNVPSAGGPGSDNQTEGF